jgi:hypothetical protein
MMMLRCYSCLILNIYVCVCVCVCVCVLTCALKSHLEYAGHMTGYGCRWHQRASLDSGLSQGVDCIV